jgi:mRNA-degrading endonuclease RelE of RelBE toxin-antitoxin system
MIFIESPIFTEDLGELLSDESYREFQEYLAENPTAGDVIQSTNGLRKVRWSANGKGKSGGVRVVYFYLSAAYQIRLILIYRKGIKDDLSPAEKKVLAELNKGWK